MKKASLVIILIILFFTDASSGSLKNHRAIIRKAAAAHKSLEREDSWIVIGRSNLNNKILCREFGGGKKTVLIIGGIHGDEPASVLSVIKLAEHLGKNPQLIKNRAVIIPCLNPDGLRLGRRTNSRKVDINRNFPSSTWSPDYANNYNNPGSEPASEPETCIAIEVLDKYFPALLIQMHQPFGNLSSDNDTPAAILHKMSEISGYPVSDNIGYSTPGSIGSFISQQEYYIMGITYELGGIDREPDYDAVTRSLIEAINFP